MEFKKGDKTVSFPVLGLLAGTVTIGAIAVEICNVISGKKK